MASEMSGAQKRRLRVERGLPARSPAELEKHRQADVRRKARRKLQLFAWIQEVKLERGCTDCGYRAHAEALEFDHLPGFEKRGGITALVTRGLSKTALEAEMTKCEVVCANCHRVRTATRRG